MQIITGIGSIFHNEKQLFSGTYRISKDSHPDRQTRQSGTFEVSGIAQGDLVTIFNLLQSTPSLILILQDGRKFDINLTLIPDNFDFLSGFAKFNLLFTPGNPEI